MPIPQQRDPQATRAALRAWLARRMPQAADLTVTELTPPAATGYSNDTLLFTATWREGSVDSAQGFVARIKPSGYQVFPEYDLERQFIVMQTLGERTDVPVPRMHWFEADPQILGAPFYVMERIEGRIPGDNPPYTVDGWVTQLDPDERTAMLDDALEVLTRIHRLDWERLGFGFLDRPALGERGLAQQVRYYEDYLVWAARGTPQPIAEAALRWLKAHWPADEPLGLCWGDARIGNMIFRDNRVRAVLDWEMVTLGNPEQDLAWWLFLEQHHTEGIGVNPLPGFPSRAETVARYETVMRRRVRHLEFYEIFAGFRFAVIMCRLAQMLLAYGVLPADSDMETNNIVTTLLARMLALPPPGGTT